MNLIAKIEKEDIVNANEIPLLQSLECSIDSLIPLDPVMCSKCRNLFCSDCIDIWKTKSSMCPMRCSPFETVSIEKTIIRDQINRIQVRCRYYQSGCTQGILILDRQNHETQCKYKPVSCKKCNDTIPSIKLIEHFKTSCQWSMIECFLCDKAMNWNTIAQHIESCSSELLTCSICYSHTHIKDQCSYRIVQCSKCNLPEIDMTIKAIKHQCPIKSDENFLNEYHSQLIKRYSDEISKLIEAKDEKLHNSLIKVKTISNEIKELTKKQIDNLDNKIIKIKDIIHFKNIGSTKDIEITISNLKSQLEMIKSEIVNKDKEEQKIKDLIFFIQSSFIKELNDQMSLKENEIALERKYLIKACQYSHQMKIGNSVINEMIQNISVTEVSNEQCPRCNINAKIKICEYCLQKICDECSAKCLNCKEKTYCSICFSKCSKCNRTLCNNCIKKCYSKQCSNVFCNECYEVNKHQVRGGSQTCKMFKCTNCNKDKICIMLTMTLDNKRYCWDCFNGMKT